MGVEEVAAHLGIAKETVYRWVEARGLPAHRVGRLLRFRLSEVDAWVAGRSGNGAATPPQPAPDRAAEPRSAYGYGSDAAPAAPPCWPVEADEVDASIQEMVRIIVERFDPERIVLFGSHARGSAGPDSDVDLLVVIPIVGSKRDVEVEIGVALHDIKLPKDIVVVTPDEARRYRDVVGTIVRPALLEGRILYERAG